MERSENGIVDLEDRDVRAAVDPLEQGDPLHARAEEDLHGPVRAGEAGRGDDATVGGGDAGADEPLPPGARRERRVLVRDRDERDDARADGIERADEGSGFGSKGCDGSLGARGGAERNAQRDEGDRGQQRRRRDRPRKTRR